MPSTERRIGEREAAYAKQAEDFQQRIAAFTDQLFREEMVPMKIEGQPIFQPNGIHVGEAASHFDQAFAALRKAFEDQNG